MAESSTTGPRAVLEQLSTLWGKQSRGRRMLAILALVGVFAVIGITRLLGGEGSWSVVADGASPDDSQELLATLQGRNLPARLKNNKVEVKTDRVDEARAIAAAAGLPRTGKGFELFDGASLGQSSFAEQVNFKRALQGELSRSIAALAQVQGARVHLALGKRSVFKDRDERASASVALHLHAGQQLTAEQVRGVRQLVAASIEGLAPDAVVVVDNHGNLLDGADPSSADKKADLERSLTGRVRSMLERVVGAGKVSVVTTAVVDDREVSETQELFDNTNPAVRSESRVIDGPNATQNIGGIAGTRGNLPGAPAAAPQPGTAGNEHVQETKNYELSRTVRQTKKPDAQLQRLYVAVLVDHKVGDDGKPVPRTKEEIAELTALARQAAGIDDTRGDKIEVRSIRFAPDEEIAVASAPTGVAAWLPPLPVLIGAGAGVLVLLVVVVMVLRRGKKQAPLRMSLALPAPVADLERVLDARDVAAGELSGASQQPALPPGRPVRDRVLSVVRSDVERTAEVLTAWLSEPPPAAIAAAAGKGMKS